MNLRVSSQNKTRVLRGFLLEMKKNYNPDKRKKKNIRHQLSCKIQLKFIHFSQAKPLRNYSEKNENVESKSQLKVQHR